MHYLIVNIIGLEYTLVFTFNSVLSHKHQLIKRIKKILYWKVIVRDYLRNNNMMSSNFSSLNSCKMDLFLLISTFFDTFALKNK